MSADEASKAAADVKAASRRLVSHPVFGDGEIVESRFAEDRCHEGVSLPYGECPR